MGKGRGGFPMGGMGGGMNMNMIRQAQKMQQDMQNFEENFKAQEFEATSGGGMVSAKVNGDHRVALIDIKPEAVDPDDVEMLCDMVAAAINEAMKACDTAHEEGLKKITGSLNIGF
ncbi:MAG: YbaB/EbfC family nucleoid-associated protein [Ruminococcaceae bacterium]|nr:YbaB/EbfC family nucleoid-associated protein [Oscillospiraceae bacterium]